MKKITLLFCIPLFMVGCRVNTTHQTPTDAATFFRYTPNRPAYVSVHRGGGEEPGIPENGIGSFTYYANLLKPCIIECDITTTRDSVLIMMHDYTLDRTTTGSGKVSDYTYNELKSLHLKDRFGTITEQPIPTLQEVLLWGRNKVYFTLDIKRGTPMRKVVEHIHQTKTEQSALIVTYNADQAFEAYRLDPNLLISVSIMKESDYERLRQGGIPDKNMVAFIGTREPKKELIDFLHSKGIMTILGTLGNLDKKAAAQGDNLYKQWKESGVDIFATDRPGAVKQIFNLN